MEDRPPAGRWRGRRRAGCRRRSAARSASRRRSCRRSRRGGRSGRPCRAARRVAVVDAEQRLGQVARDRHGCGRSAPSRSTSAVELVGGALAHEHVDVALALEQALEQVAADEAGRPRHEVVTLALLGPPVRSLYGRLPAAAHVGARACGPWRRALRASLRFSRRHWIMLITKMNSGKKAIRMKPGVRDHLVVRLAPQALAAVVRERGGRAQREQGGGEQEDRGRPRRASRPRHVPWRHGRRHRLGPRQGHGGHPAAAGRLVQARAPRAADAVGPQRLGQDDAAADAVGETSVDGGQLAFAKDMRVALHDQRPPRDRDLSLRDYVLGGCGDLLALEARLARARAADGRGRTRRRDAGRLRARAGAAGARRRLQLARGRQRDAARARLPRRAPRPRARRPSPAAS